MTYTALFVCLWLTLMPGALVASPGHAGDVAVKKPCRHVSVDTWPEVEKSLAGKELIAFASWCSSCKQKLLSTKSAPENFVLVSVFEEPEQSARAMERLGLASPCVYGRELPEVLGIKGLPWSKKF